MPDATDIAGDLLDDLIALRPVLATSLGVDGHDHEWGDFGEEAAQRTAGIYRDLESRAAAAAATASTARQARVLGAVARERLEAFEAGDRYRSLRHLGSPFHSLISVFDLMGKDTAEDWDDIATRLETIDAPIRSYRAMLAEGLSKGQGSPRRQVLSIASQAEESAGPGSAYLGLLERAGEAGHSSERIERAVDHARSAMSGLADWLRDSYAPSVPAHDPAGEERYRREASRLVGAEIDPGEAYEWGWAELMRLRDELVRVGEEISPGAGIDEVRRLLESGAGNVAESRAELLEFVDSLMARTVGELAGTHFTVPEEIRPLTSQIAPPGTPIGVYYRPPSEDFSRPGGIWYSVGDETVFPLYQHVSTAYHEGFPGHHLQIATAMHNRDLIPRSQRILVFYPGYSEGWAMYAEVLMGELGYLEEPDRRFGMLAKQSYRAARVVADIGLHLEKRIPEWFEYDGGEPWGFERAIEFMRRFGFRTGAQAEAEVLRYLGWPGQAITYKLGERELLRLREEAVREAGAGFDLRSFHEGVLRSGPMRFEELGRAVRKELPAG